MVMQYEQATKACMVRIHMQIIDLEALMLTRMREMLTTTCGLTMRNMKERWVGSCLIQAGTSERRVY